MYIGWLQEQWDDFLKELQHRRKTVMKSLQIITLIIVYIDFSSDATYYMSLMVSATMPDHFSQRHEG